MPDHSKKPDLLNWLGLRRNPDWSKARVIGPLITVIFTLLFILAIATAFVMLGKALFGAALDNPRGTLGIGAVTVALIGAPFVIWRSIVAQKQADIAEQGQITDRINKAVEGLGAVKTQKDVYETPRYKKKDGEWVRDEDGNPVQARRPDREPLIDVREVERTVPNLEVRIGAIYALERISKDSPDDHFSIMEILCAYIRENGRIGSRAQGSELRADIDAAMKVLGRRPQHLVDICRERLSRGVYRKRFYLSNVDLSYADLSDLKFHQMEFGACSFEKAAMHGTQFEDCILNGSDLSNAAMKKGVVHGHRPFLSFCLFSGENALNFLEEDHAIDTIWCAVREADLTGLRNFDPCKWFGDASVTLPSGHGPEHESWPKHWPKFKLESQDFLDEWRK